MISLAFDNEVVLTDDFASSLRRLMSPLSQKQTDEILVYSGGPDLEANVYLGYPMGGLVIGDW
jgi:hypothetical protein